jgi:hypothetical protein
VNLLSLIFAQIYFPTYSNGLKEIGRYLGFHWPEGVGSGLESIVWRSRWEVSRDPEEKQRLLDYNRLDCEALERVREVNCSALVVRPRKKPEMRAKTSQRARSCVVNPPQPHWFLRIPAAQWALAWVLAMRKVVWRA